MQFVLDAQAKFWAGMEAAKSRQDDFEKRQTEFDKRQTEFDKRQATLQASIERLAESCSLLVDSQSRLVEDQRKSREEIAALAKRTDESLGALIAVVDGLVRRPPQ